MKKLLIKLNQLNKVNVKKCLGEEIKVGQNHKTLARKRLRVEKDYLGWAF